MGKHLIFFNFLVYLTFLTIVSTQNHSNIGDCDYDGFKFGITFICGDISAYSNQFFTSGVQIFCRNQQSSRDGDPHLDGFYLIGFSQLILNIVIDLKFQTTFLMLTTMCIV